jgi:pilus assembly protein CpaB
MKRRLIFFAITAFIGVLIVMLISSALKTKQAAIEALEHERVRIVVAAHDLTAGSVVDAASVKLAVWPREDLPPGALMDVSSLQGQIVKQSVIENQPIVSSMLLRPGNGGGVLPFLIPNGMRAMSIPVTPVSDMAGMILPHARVDVLVSSNEGTDTRTKIVLQDVEVLAVQNLLDSSGNEPQRAEVVTLLVTPQDAERLAAAIRLGALQIAMRGYADRQPVWTTGVDSRELVGLPPLPAAPQESSAINSSPRVVAIERTASKPRVGIAVELMRNGKERQTITFDRGTPGFNPQLAGATNLIESDPPQSSDTQ